MIVKCHYTYDKKAGKVLIPGCMAVAVSGYMEDCTCRNMTNTVYEFGKERFNKVVAEKQTLINELEKENSRLNRMIKNLLKP